MKKIHDLNKKLSFFFDEITLQKESKVRTNRVNIKDIFSISHIMKDIPEKIS